jgi:hypothetical protein
MLIVGIIRIIRMPTYLPTYLPHTCASSSATPPAIATTAIATCRRIWHIDATAIATTASAPSPEVRIATAQATAGAISAARTAQGTTSWTRGWWSSRHCNSSSSNYPELWSPRVRLLICFWKCWQGWQSWQSWRSFKVSHLSSRPPPPLRRCWCC